LKYASPSDFTAIAPDYSPSSGAAKGYYTTSDLVAQLLQIPDFTTTTSPSSTEVGSIIKRIEDYIDEVTRASWRPIRYSDEFHDFIFSGVRWFRPLYWSDYVGFIQLHNPDIRKVIRLAVWQGSSWKDLASASAKVKISDYTNITSVVLKTPGFSGSDGVFTLTAGTTAATWDKTFGNKTAAEELVALINEVYPARTADMTGASAAKALQDGAGNSNISDFFYATADYEDNRVSVIVSSLLPGEDGSNCVIEVNGSGLTKNDFTDNEEMRRLGSWWAIEADGKIFFRKNFPYLERQSIKVTYVGGNHRVPGIITDATTKLVACEILRHDDSTVLIAETGAQIDIRAKYDLLKEEANNSLELMKETVFLIE
jgi:hypothetical protein